MATPSSASIMTVIPARRFWTLLCALALAAVAGSAGLAAEPKTFRPAEPINSVVDTTTWAQRAEYRGSFPAAGRVIAEVSGLPADCAVQVGSQGFAATEDSPVDWTDGTPGATVRHVFAVEAGKPGKVWVMIRNRSASVSVGDWRAVSCSPTGPWYALPEPGAAAPTGPADYEGRPVRPPITFVFRAGTEADLAPKPAPGAATGGGLGAGDFWFDADLGFGFEVPAGWRVEKDGAAKRRLRVPAGHPLASVKLEVRVDPAGGSVGAAMNRVHAERAEAGAALGAMGPLTVGGQAGMFAGHATESSGLSFADAVVLNGGRCYRISCEAPADRFDEAGPLFRGLVGSFSFEKR